MFSGFILSSSLGSFFEVVISIRNWSPLLHKCTVDLYWNLVILKKAKQKMKAYLIAADHTSSLLWGDNVLAYKLLLSDGSLRAQSLLCLCSALLCPVVWPSHLFMQECSRQMQDVVWSIQSPVLSGNLKVTLVKSEKLCWKISLWCCCYGNCVYCVWVWLLDTAVWKSIALKSASLPPFLGGLSAAKADKASLIKPILPILLLVLLLVQACCLIGQSSAANGRLAAAQALCCSVVIIQHDLQRHSTGAGYVPFLLCRGRGAFCEWQWGGSREQWRRTGKDVLHGGGVERSTQGMPERWAEKTIHQQES